MPGVILFGIPDAKDPHGTARPTPRARCRGRWRPSARRARALSLWADVCLCEYTDHGHCGPLGTAPTGEVRSTTTPRCRGWPTPRSATRAPAPTSSRPSDMMDGRVARHPRGARCRRPHRRGASSPTRRSTPRPSTGRSARRPARRRRSAIGAATRWIPRTRARRSREVDTDLDEGADIVMVKPALAYLDVIRRVQGPRSACRSRPTTCRASTR